MIKYCLPIIKKTKRETLELIDKNKSNYQFFEVWVDYIEDLDDKFIQKLSEDLQQKLILVFRRQNLEKIKMSHHQIINLINIVKNNGCLIDLDITTQKQELDFLKQNSISIKTIASYHNYQITPDEKTLTEIIDNMKPYRPYLYKIACMCHNEENAVKLLQLLLNLKKQNYKFIVLGMGDKGMITRVFGTLWGNEMVFAPLSKNEESAPGQLTKEQLEQIFSKIH